MKIYNYIIYTVLAIAMILIMTHLVYVHAELLNRLNPYDRNWYRSLLFSVAYSFLTITVIALLQKKEWNIAFAFADAISVALYYFAPLFLKNELNYYILIQGSFYSVLTGIATYTLGSLSLKYFADSNFIVTISKRELQLEERLKVTTQTIDNLNKEKVSLSESIKESYLKITDLQKIVNEYESKLNLHKKNEIPALKYEISCVSKSSKTEENLTKLNSLKNKLKKLEQ